MISVIIAIFSSIIAIKYFLNIVPFFLEVQTMHISF